MGRGGMGIAYPNREVVVSRLGVWSSMEGVGGKWASPECPFVWVGAWSRRGAHLDITVLPWTGENASAAGMERNIGLVMFPK